VDENWLHGVRPRTVSQWQSHRSVENRAVGQNEKNSMTRRDALIRLSAQAGVGLTLAGCGSDTVELKGGTDNPATTGKVTAKIKKAQEVEDALLKDRKIH
jgi:hypothetical protein